MNFKHYIAAISIGLLAGSFHADAAENVLGNKAKEMSEEFKANKAKIASESNALKKQMAVDKNMKLSSGTEVLAGLIAIEKKNDPSLPRFYVNCVKLTSELCQRETENCNSEGEACSRKSVSSVAAPVPAEVASSPNPVASHDGSVSECPIGSNKRSRECADFDLTQPDVMDKANNTFDRYDDEGSVKKCARLKNDAAWLANCQSLSLADCAKEGLCMVKEGKCGLNLDKVRALMQEREAKGWTKPTEVQFPCPVAAS